MTQPFAGPLAAGSASPTPAAAVATGQADRKLAWLLEEFVRRVRGTEGAVLVSRDGLPLAAADLTAAEADRLAAVVSGISSLGAGIGKIKEPFGDTVQMIAVQVDVRWGFAMDCPVDPGTTESRMVGCVLGVLAVPQADTRVIQFEMAALVTGVAEHLGTRIRDTGDAGPVDPPGSGPAGSAPARSGPAGSGSVPAAPAAPGPVTPTGEGAPGHGR